MEQVMGRSVQGLACVAVCLVACATDTDGMRASRDPGAGAAGAGTGAGQDAESFGNPDGRPGPARTIVNVPGEDGHCGATRVEAERVVVEERYEVEEEVTTVTPVAINIMLDQSGSMGGLPAMFPYPATPESWPDAVDSIEEFVRAPKSQGLRVALQYFPVDDDEFTCDGSGYDEPEVPFGLLESDGRHAGRIADSLDEHEPDGDTPIEGALRGATSYCRMYKPTDPLETCVVVFITDGAPTECNANHGQLAAIAGDAAADGVITYAVGLQGSDFALLDAISVQGGAEDCDSAAPAYACDVTAGSEHLIDALNRIRETVVTTVTHTETVEKTLEMPLGCEWVLPPPDDVQVGFDRDEVNVQFSAPGSPDTVLARVAAKTDCVADAWYYDDAADPTRIIACPETCDAIQTTREARVDILLGCPTHLVD